MTALRTDSSAYPGYIIVRGALLYKDRITLAKDFPWVLMALEEGHDSKIGEGGGGHGGFLKT